MKKTFRWISRSKRVILADMSLVVLGGVGMHFIPRPRIVLANVGTSCCVVRSWRVELRVWVFYL